jgi:hypothetical protein
MSENEISLKEYFDDKIEEVTKLYESKLFASDKAVQLASETLSIRLNSMNEFRSQLKDQAATLLTKNEFDIQHQKVLDDIRVLRDSKATLEGKASQLSANIALGIAVIGVIISIISLFHGVAIP